mgnify:CR=1 FL=1
MPIIDGRDNANSSLDWNMGGHSLTIDAKANGIRIDQSNTNVNIHNADTITAEGNYKPPVYSGVGSGNSISYRQTRILY